MKPITPPLPRGLAEIKKVFGEPGKVRLDLVDVEVPGYARKRVRFYCHHLLQPILRWCFEEIGRRGLGHRLKSFDGCYNPRLMRASATKWSTHAWGIAIDTNANRNFKAPGTADQAAIAAVFQEAGFIQLKHDPMHHQWCAGY
jgi:hypothetical protein